MAYNNKIIIKDKEEIYQLLENVDVEVFERHLEDLEDIEYLVKTVNDAEDRVYYQAKHGLDWTKIVELSCEIKRQILFYLINNPHTFFVLLNTQGGKTNIVGNEMRNWALCVDKRIVAFKTVTNDMTLGSQSANSLLQTIDEDHCEKFLLSSSGDRVSMTQMKKAIDYYGAFGGKMPLFIGLDNPTQIKKLIELMEHVRHRMLTHTHCSKLGYGMVFDEPDKVYPGCRDRFKHLLVDDIRGLYRLGFVSATEGDLINNDDYPECANACMYQVPDPDPNYRAMHSADASVKYFVKKSNMSNNEYAEAVIQANKEHFFEPITLNDGTKTFHKTIVNSNSNNDSMNEFADIRNSEGANAFIINMRGVTLRKNDGTRQTYSSKKVLFRELLFKIYKEHNLHEAPLFIIGCRKVDRGLGFHYAPNEGEGLIWNNLILGRIEDKDQAVQKAGRLAGKVAHCPQYPGKLTWWTDQETACKVINHNNTVDKANELVNGYSLLQAVHAAKQMIPVIVPQIPEEGPQVPKIVEITESEYATIPVGRNKLEKIQAVLRILESKDQSLADRLREYSCKEVTAPREVDGDSYKNHVLVAVRCSETNHVCSVTLSREEKNAGNVWNCFIDKHHLPKRLCFIYVNPC